MGVKIEVFRRKELEDFKERMRDRKERRLLKRMAFDEAEKE